MSVADAVVAVVIFSAALYLVLRSVLNGKDKCTGCPESGACKSFQKGKNDCAK